MSRRPTLAGMAGRRHVRLPQQLVQDDRDNCPDQDKHGTENTGPVGVVLAVRAGVILLTSQCGGLQSIHATGVMQNVHALMRNCNLGLHTHSMKASHDTCGHLWQRRTPVDFCRSGVLRLFNGPAGPLTPSLPTPPVHASDVCRAGAASQ